MRPGTFPHQRMAGFLSLTFSLLSILISAPAQAQVAGGTLSGTVTDQSGALIPNGQISIVNVATGVTREVATDAAGFYTAPNLIPGNYEVTASAPGFSTEVRTGITLTVGAQQVLNLTLRVGRTTEKVEVAGEAPAVQLATSSISAVVNSTTVRELPLNGRSWTDLAALQPGVAAIQTQAIFNAGADRGTRGFGAQISVSGARPQQNNYRLDGVSINDYANGGPGSVLGGDLGVDAIQEFSVLTSNYSAEYGKTSGGVVNAITRSGTNQFHGSVYEFLRNDALDARNFFDNGSIPPFRRNQFGAAAGGPVRKDRTFIFGDYEAIRQSEGISVVDTVPSPAARAGNLSSGTVVVDPAAQKYLGFYPLPNGAILAPGDTGVFTFVQQQVVSENFFTARVDHRISEKDSLFGTYMYDDTPFTLPDSLDDVLLGHHTNRQFVVLEENHIFNPSLVNSVRVGYNRAGVSNEQSVSAINPLAADTSLGGVPGTNAAQVFVSGLTPFSGGIGGPSHYFFFWNSFQGYDDAFLTRGTHSLKFGGGVERVQHNYIALSDLTGLFSFGSLSDFLTNTPSRFQATFSNITPRGLRETVFGAYLQDDWRWRPGLTLNLGLRYEMSTVPSEVQGKLNTLINLTDANPHLGNPYFQNPTLRNFEPRVGFAWDPLHDGKLAVRGGFGMFDVLPLPYEIQQSATQGAPYSLQGSTSSLSQGSFFAGAYSSLGLNSLSTNSIEQKPHRNYVMQWNLNVQRELTPSLAAMVGYVGSRGVHQPFRSDSINIVMPTLTSVGYLWPVPVGSGTLLNTHLGEIKSLVWGGNSFYDALQVGVQKRMSRGFQLQGSYTWEKSIDTSSTSMVGDAFANSIASPHWYNIKLNRGLSDFNVGRIFVIDGTWQVPAPKSFSGPAAWILDGWELGGIYKASDGVPFTATFGTDGDPLGLGNTDPWDFPNRLTGPGCATLTNPGNANNYIKTQCFAVPTAPASFFTASTPLCSSDPQLNVLFGPGSTQGTPPQCFNLRGNSGRNILIGPGTSNLDFSLFKNNYVKRISENFNIQFRAEFFNILNRANFHVPTMPDNTDIFDSTGAPTGAAGLLTSTTTTAREIQFAIKLVW